MLILLTFSSAFALFVNGEIAYKILRGRKSHLGPYIAHIGIALFLIGVLATAGHSKQRQVDLIKGEKVSVLGHDLTFVGWEPFDNGKKYHFNIEVKDGNSTKIVSPVMFVAEFNNSMMREPDIWVGFLKDFYIEPKGYSDGTENREGTTISLKKGETQNINGVDITFNEFDFPPEVRNAMMAGKDFKVGAKFSVKFNGKTEDVETVMQSTGGNREFIPVELKEANIKMVMGNLNAAGSIELKVSSLDVSASNIPPKEVLSIEASVKPFISLVWIGVLTMAAGFLISAFRRSKESLLQISTPVVK
jgi:cytochrome c-type biogenesis protein CcmF